MDLDVRQRYPFFTGSKRHKKFPFAPGFPIHECVGQVSESTSSLFKPGEMVIAIPDGNQALAEYFVAQASKSVLLSPDLGNSDAICLIQPLSTVLNAVDRLGNIEGCSITVVGLGSTGLFFCWLLRKRGARRIVGIDPSEHRCYLAKNVGADRAYPMRSIEVVHLARQNPDLNPTEWVWSYLKLADLANIACDHLPDLEALVINSKRRMQRRPQLIQAFVRNAGYEL